MSEYCECDSDWEIYTLESSNEELRAEIERLEATLSVEQGFYPPEGWENRGDTWTKSYPNGKNAWCNKMHHPHLHWTGPNNTKYQYALDALKAWDKHFKDNS